MPKKKVGKILHKRKKTSKVRNKVTCKTFKKTKKGKKLNKSQYGGGYNEKIVQEKIEEWNKELKKKCPTLELKFDYQEKMRNNMENSGIIVGLEESDKYILCLFNEVDCISSISFDFDYNKKNGKYYVEINSETQKDMKNKKYNKFLRATLIKLLCVIEHEADIKADYIYSNAVNLISLLNLLPYELTIIDSPGGIISKHFGVKANTEIHYNPKEKGKEYRSIVKSSILKYEEKLKQYYKNQNNRRTKEIEIRKKIQEKYYEIISNKVSEIEKLKEEYRIANKRTISTRKNQKKNSNRKKDLSNEIQEFTNKREKEIYKKLQTLNLVKIPSQYQPVEIKLNIEQNIDEAKAIWNKLLSKLDESESIKCP